MANLYKAIFVNADLRGADFRGAELQGANFEGAKVDQDSAEYLTAQGFSGFVIVE